MILSFDEMIANEYKSESQRVRVMSETWVARNMYCPNCGRYAVKHLLNNKPVADFQCENCGEIFELKSKEGNVGRKITDGAYSTMIERITSATNPNLFFLQYARSYQIINLIIIPKFFFVPSIIEKRKPLSSTARRAGWTGCNILYKDIPIQGRINAISNGTFCDTDSVVEAYNKIKRIETSNIDNRTWLFDVLNCVNSIDKDEFTLSEIYENGEHLQNLHPNNHNIEAKIRQQLQLLRDKGLIEFSGRGRYKKN